MLALSVGTAADTGSAATFNCCHEGKKADDQLVGDCSSRAWPLGLSKRSKIERLCSRISLVRSAPSMLAPSMTHSACGPTRRYRHVLLIADGCNVEAGERWAGAVTGLPR